MPIVVRDLVPEFLAQTPATGAERPASWQRYRERISKYHDPGLDERRLAELFTDSGRLTARADVIRRTASTALSSAAGLMGVMNVDVQVVVLVGLFTANGWVAPLNGRAELFVAVERYPNDERYGRLLLIHEASHVVHDRAGDHASWPEHGIAAALMSEGLATLVSSLAEPGLSDAQCLWFAEGFEDWHQACRTHQRTVLDRLLAALDGDNPDTYAAYFQMRDSPERGDLPRRCGYYVGLNVVRELHRYHPLAELARWPYTRVVTEVRQALTMLRDA
ncbi:hypothetical protein GCM10010435_85360 [Winogradskya consettensis]|uniref:DUF2268 domain-containing protein n=1 Tax=Winogradskya consettensis TaxID=113560 RepID=A0A919SIE2_9ACTN|nr:hypothetical protein [Actinoplanes consettensis]GIM72586.1 hypothetical protein Aco04nite_31040 [Actinoplanes consettensis]